MSLLDDAKLILIPSGYGDGKWYSYKGDDFSVTQNTSNATRFNRYGKIESVPANTPRIDWLNGTPDALVDLTATNEIQYSEDYNVSYWNKYNSTITTNDVPSILKGELADRIVQNTGTFALMRREISSALDLDVYSFSCYVKKESVDNFFHLFFRFQPNTVTGASIQFNKKTGDFLINPGISSSLNQTIDADVVSVGDYWYVYVTAENTDSTNNEVRAAMYPNRGTSLGNLDQVDGDAVVAGIQFENSDLPTSLIPTAGAIATRNDEIETVTPPAGTTEIREYLPNGTYNSITTIPATYQIPNGRWQKIIML